MLDAPQAGAERSLDHMLDASPLVIERLREHTSSLTGVDSGDYRDARAEARQRFADRLHALVASEGDELLVPERRELGGFGYELGGELYNLETLKFFECLIALQRGGILRPLRDRPAVVCEIGADWGGFAYQFKSLCPKAAYVIIDLPERLLFSAVYLMTLFPEARVRFWEQQTSGELLSSLEEVDFVFIPAAALDSMRPAHLDLALNVDETTAPIEAYVKRAHELGCPYFFTLNRDRVPRLAQYYWLHPVPVLDLPYHPLVSPPLKGKLGRGAQVVRGRLDEQATQNEHEHVVGWRRAEP